jgi:hypothetical protein
MKPMPNPAKACHPRNLLSGIRLSLIPAFAGMTLLSVSVFAADGDFEEEYAQGSTEWAAQKARHAHDMASSDVIYQQEDLRALYYQNQVMIDLLKDMRDSQRETLRLMRQKAAEDAPAEEKG